MAARVVLMLRRVDVHRVHGAPRTAAVLALRAVLRFALLELGGHFGVVSVLPLGSDILAGHGSISRFEVRSRRAAHVPSLVEVHAFRALRRRSRAAARRADARSGWA